MVAAKTANQSTSTGCSLFDGRIVGDGGRVDDDAGSMEPPPLPDEPDPSPDLSTKS